MMPNLTPAANYGAADLSNDMNAAIAMVQSPYLYLHAAGSDGSDGSVSGIDLRWFLLRSLLEHLPKGNLAVGPGAPYPATYGFNRADDFVKLLRVHYGQQYPCTVNFSTSRPVAVVETGPQRIWKFDTVVQSTTPNPHREVIIRFSDITQYDTIRATLNPLTVPDRFLTQYTGIVEAEVTNQLCFALSIKTGKTRATKKPTARTTQAAQGPVLRVEAISVSENFVGADLFISCRKMFATELGYVPIPESRVCAENVQYFRFDYTRCVPVELRLETYEQFIQGAITQKEGPWQEVGTGFSLTDQDTVAYNRLEAPQLMNVHHK
jgi:hypothetical protein